MNVGAERELDSAFALLRDQQAGAIIVAPDTFLSSRRDQILARRGTPYPCWRHFASILWLVVW